MINCKKNYEGYKQCALIETRGKGCSFRRGVQDRPPQYYSTHADITTMQFSTRRVIDIIEHVGHKDTLITCKIRWLGKARIVDVVGRTPGRIDPYLPEI